MRQVLVAEEVVRYAVRLADSSRPGRGAKLDFIEKWVKWGAGPARVARARDRRQGARAAARPPPRVGEGHPGAGQADPAPPRAAELLRRGRRHHRRIASSISCSTPCRCPPAGCRPWLAQARYLDPAIVARLGTIDLKARTIVEGFLTGLHRSPYKGFSVEFAEYRQYLPGDDLATLDWKVFARSDRHFVKKFEEETNLTCHLLLDVSALDGLRLAAASPSCSTASYLAGALAYLMHRQRDAFGLIAFDDSIVVAAAGERARRPPARGAAGARAAASSARAPTSPSRCSDLAAAVRKRGLVVLISDLLDDPARVLDGLKHFRYRGTDVIVFHVLDPYELKFPFEQAARFRDMETAEEVMAVPGSVRAGLPRARCRR